MLPSERIILARYTTPNGEIQLQQRPLPDGSLAFEIISNGVFLMASYNQISERALARYTLESVSNESKTDQRVLVGGLGMGFTLQETLSYEVAAVDVVEINPHIVDWNQTYFSSLNEDVLAEPRVRLIQDDLYTLLYTTQLATYDAILFDVDNGPSWLVDEANARLYTGEALKRWSALLIPGGSFAVWSAQRELEFLGRLQDIFPQAEEIPINVPDHKNELVENFIYQATKSSD